MEKLLGYKPFHFLLFLVLGISFQFYTDCWNFGIVTSLCIFLFLVLICYSLRKSSFFGLLIGSVFFFIGIFILHNGDATKDENYFGNHTANNAAVVLKINSILKSGNYHQKYIAEVIQINQKITTGEVLLNIEKDCLSVNFNINDKILLENNFVGVSEPLNPHQFNYKKYLENKGIRQQIYSTKKEILFLNSGRFFTFRCHPQDSIKNSKIIGSI